jgi:hypothetical protein
MPLTSLISANLTVNVTDKKEPLKFEIEGE